LSQTYIYIWTTKCKYTAELIRPRGRTQRKPFRGVRDPCGVAKNSETRSNSSSRQCLASDRTFETGAPAPPKRQHNKMVSAGTLSCASIKYKALDKFSSGKLEAAAGKWPYKCSLTHRASRAPAPPNLGQIKVRPAAPLSCASINHREQGKFSSGNREELLERGDERRICDRRRDGELHVLLLHGP
jgi:hypothetical protein